MRDAYRGASFRLRPSSRTIVEAAPSIDTVESCLEMVARNFPGGIAQIPSEIGGFIDYASALSPKLALEIGSASSGNAYLLAQTLPTLRSLICLDLHVRNRSHLRALTRENIALHLIDGVSQRPDIVEKVRMALSGRSLDVLFIDGDHSFSGVFLDFFLYRELVRPGGLIAFHDIVPDGRLRYGEQRRGAYVGEVPAVWGRLKQYYSTVEFVEDPSQDGLGIGVLRYDPEVVLRPLDLVL
jgi:predicted O-methyltransferase YrrM